MLDVLHAVRPYLLVKGQQADLLIEFITDFQAGAFAGYGGGRRIAPEELERRERIFHAVKALNHLSRGRLNSMSEAAA